MAAPYWGQLPPPKVTRTSSVKRQGNPGELPDHLTNNAEIGGPFPIQTQFAVQPQVRQNRYSTQTTHTEAPTVSTQSPFASPTASSFRGDGLAPRPASFGYGAYENRDYLETRKRRQSRNKEQFYEDSTSVPPPAAPDAPKPAPPVSYKPPYSNGAPSTQQGPVHSRSIQRADGPTSSNRERPEEYLRSGHRDQYAMDDRHATARRASKGKAVERNGDAELDSEMLGRNNATQAEARKGSISEAEAQRRREWAPDRSPLQRLELTLDSITKEEKRARVEEAELLAREAKAGRGGERATQNSVRFRNRPVAKNTHESVVQQEPQSLAEAGLVRNLSNRQKDQLQRSGTVETKRPVQSEIPPANTTRGFDYQAGQEVIPDPQKPVDSSVTRRKPSTRDHSAQPFAAEVAEAVGAAALGRSGSNKLKKDPPGDPWFNRRKDAESRYQDFTPRKPSAGDQHQETSSPVGPSRGTAFASHPQTARDKELPMLPRTHNQVSEHLIDQYFDGDMETKPVRRGSTRKIEQLTGMIAPPQAPRSIPPSQQQMPADNLGHADHDPAGTRQQRNEVRTELVTVNGVKYAIPPAPADHGAASPGQEAHGRLHLSSILHHDRDQNLPGTGVYVPSRRLDEWKKGGVALLAGELLDLDIPEQTEAEKDKAWWEAGHTGKRRRSSTKQRKAEAYDGEYDDTNAPTRFKPPLFLKSGPILRYCGLRNETLQGRSARNGPPPRREIWRGSVMIVTEDSKSSYELAPTLRLFLQPVTLLPPPPAQVGGEIDALAPEYVDPIAGLPKVGRDGRTLYVRPVEHLEEAKDLSREDSDAGLFEANKSPLDGATNAKKSASQNSQYDGEKAGKYKEIRGFRLHSEYGVTFWKFNVEVELRDKQQRIAYRINRGPATGFWVPARDEAMNIMFYSCNGFSHDIDPNEFSGPDPMWRDVLNTHQTQPFHVMLGGGDQLYMDAVMVETTIFKEWTEIKDPHHKEHVPFTAELQHELEAFYLNRYAMWFSQGLFGVAVSQIPMINVYDDHDIIDGFGSYPDRYMRSPVMSGLGAIAFKYYMLFQHQSSIDEGEDTEPSWILGSQPGPYIPELSRSIFTFLGRSIAFLGLDCRTERMHDEVVSVETYDKVFSRLERDIVKGQTKHLIVLLGVPVAYPRMVWLENILTSRLMDPVKALGRAGLLGKGLLNHLDGGVEILDDLDDHWTAKHHKDERNWFIQELQNLAAEKSVRITILGGDVHLGAIGQFYSNPKLKIPKDHDHRYMPNVISSAIANSPPPDALADLLNKRNKVHHLDADTDEDMIPIFTHDVNGKPRNNKRLLNRRNWCSIRIYDPGLDPPMTPEASFNGSPSPPPRRGILRRLSTSRGPSYRPDAAPPLSSTGFFNRRASMDRRGSTDSARPGVLTRTLSLTRKDFIPSGLFRRNSKRRKHDGGINGYGSESESDMDYDPQQNARSGLRGGGTEEGSYFPAMTQPTNRGLTHPDEPASKTVVGSNSQQGFTPRSQFHRTPTGLTAKQRATGQFQEINLEGGLDICLNMEVNTKDPAGITMPYRLLVPALWYEEGEEGEAAKNLKGGIKRWVSFARRGPKHKEERLADFNPEE